MKALLISTYEMGRQPFGLASAAAWLRRAGWDVACADLARQRLDAEAVPAADLIGIHLPMHTATRLAGPVIRNVRGQNAGARICAFGLYAPLNAAWLRSIGVDDVLGGEFEEELTRIAASCGAALQGCTGDAGLKPCATGDVASAAVGGAALQGCAGDAGLKPSATGDVAGAAVGRAALQGWEEDAGLKPRATAALPRLRFLVPDRTGLPPLSRYASLQMPDGSRRLVGYTEATRGCKHLCRHCPIVPIYHGQFRIVQPDIVLADVDAQVAAGARHITFGDPDFLNGPTHAMRIVDALHASHPGVTYDATIKVEHLLKHRDLLPRLAATGCAFVTSAVESLDDRVLAILDKGHTRADFLEAATACRCAGLTLVPTFVAFHPWLTLEGYCDLIDTIASMDLVDHVAPIQLAIRLLVPQGSYLLTVDEMRRHLVGFDPGTLTHRWAHPDHRVDALHDAVSAIVGARIAADRRSVFDEIAALAHDRAGLPRPDPRPARDRATVPYLNEPWYC